VQHQTTQGLERLRDLTREAAGRSAAAAHGLAVALTEAVSLREPRGKRGEPK
jgi:hypothetical protein